MEFQKDFIDRLIKADRVIFFTGAGISAESGISTFRGKNGLWSKFKPEELANFDAFIKNPDLVWQWYQYRRKIINESKPNKGHLSIAEMEDYFEEVTVITQNVDNLHRRAGSKNILELHGNIERNYCVNCKTFYGLNEFEANNRIPRCKKCGGLIRPDVVWFGENLPAGVFENAELYARKSDICFIVGTSAIVYPAAYIPVTAKKSGAYLVEINIEETEITGSVNYSIIGKSGEVLPQIAELVKSRKKNYHNKRRLPL